MTIIRKEPKVTSMNLLLLLPILFFLISCFCTSATTLMASSVTSDDDGDGAAAPHEMTTTMTTMTTSNSGDGGGSSSSTTVVVLEDFCHPIHTWKEMNDPVMGGKSTGSFTVDADRCVGQFVGQVVDVPFLHAPGFIQSRTTDDGDVPFADVSRCEALQVHCMSHTPYNGYRISFGNAHPKGGKFFAYGYKAKLNVVAPIPATASVQTNDIQIITIPFTDFTDFWDDATGDAIYTCQDNKEYCPDEFTLTNMRRMSIWAEGVGGTVALDVYKIVAVGCDDEDEM